MVAVTYLLLPQPRLFLKQVFLLRNIGIRAQSALRVSGATPSRSPQARRAVRRWLQTADCVLSALLHSIDKTRPHVFMLARARFLVRNTGRCFESRRFLCGDTRLPLGSASGGYSPPVPP